LLDSVEGLKPTLCKALARQTNRFLLGTCQPSVQVCLGEPAPRKAEFMKRGTLVSGSFCGHPGAMWQLLGASRNFLEPGAPRSFLGLFGSLGQPMEALWNPWAAYGSLWDSRVLPGACSPSESFGGSWEAPGPFGNPWVPLATTSNPLDILAQVRTQVLETSRSAELQPHSDIRASKAIWIL